MLVNIDIAKKLLKQVSEDWYNRVVKESKSEDTPLGFEVLGEDLEMAITGIAHAEAKAFIEVMDRRGLKNWEELEKYLYESSSSKKLDEDDDHIYEAKNKAFLKYLPMIAEGFKRELDYAIEDISENGELTINIDYKKY